MATHVGLQGLGTGRLATVAAAPLVQQGLLVPFLTEYADAQPVPVYAVIARARRRLHKIKTCIDYSAAWF